MPQDIAFDEPVIVQISSQPIRTVDQAAQIVRSHLRAQFTMQRLTTLLVLNVRPTVWRSPRRDKPSARGLAMKFI